MTFTAKAFIVCDLGRRGADLSWPTVMPFNTVINPDIVTGIVGRGLTLGTLLPPFCVPAHHPWLCSLQGSRQGELEPEAPMCRVMVKAG